MEEDEELERIKRKMLRDLTENKNQFDTPIEVTDSTFNEVIRKNPLVVIDCWAAWCAPCRMIAPVVEELAGDYKGKIVFGKLNVDSNMETAGEYGIMSIPTLLVFKNGRLVDQIIGALPRVRLESKITKHL